MTNQDLVKSRMADARKFLEEALEQGRFVVSTVETLLTSREQ